MPTASEGYTAKASAVSAIESIKKNAPGATVIDDKESKSAIA